MHWLFDISFVVWPLMFWFLCRFHPKGVYFYFGRKWRRLYGKIMIRLLGGYKNVRFYRKKYWVVIHRRQTRIAFRRGKVRLRVRNRWRTVGRRRRYGKRRGVRKWRRRRRRLIKRRKRRRRRRARRRRRRRRRYRQKLKKLRRKKRGSRLRFFWRRRWRTVIRSRGKYTFTYGGRQRPLRYNNITIILI